MVREGLVGVWVGFGGVCEPLSLFGQMMEIAMDIYQIIKWFNSTRQNVFPNNTHENSMITRYQKLLASGVKPFYDLMDVRCYFHLLAKE